MAGGKETRPVASSHGRGEEIYVGPLGRHSSHLIKYFEEKQKLNQGAQYTSSGLKRSIFPHSILLVFLYPMYGMPMETTIVILAKPTIRCSEILVRNIHSSAVRDNLLGSWLQKVHYYRNATKLLYPIFKRKHNKISSTQWVLCMLLFYFLVYRMPVQCSQ
ncbi:hypothetical protein HYC85_009076 [Camellia sinensis]|uniref:Uncharacterized protein n=1 Tax=Camellia sinensis TaxID=4442 RepID=A0A7J7HDZ6_CAMSI|nr:hypothetical protein HYC85_009076 [Camellia sinensis]